MMKSNLDNITAVILAAGKGSRMKINGQNKVTLSLAGQPMIQRTISNLKNTGLKNIVVVVGHAKETVISLLDNDIKTVEQKRRLGTGHAVKVALKNIPNDKEAVLVVYGDDSFLYTRLVLNQLFDSHFKDNSSLTFLTTEVENPFGLGRILRNNKNQVIGIVEEKNASDKEKQIKEVNLGCYIFNQAFLKKHIHKIPKNPLKKEYYLTDLVQIAVDNQLPVQAINIPNLKWRGVNTPEELLEAEKILQA